MNTGVKEKKKLTKNDLWDYMPSFDGFNTSNVTDMGFMFTGFMFGVDFAFGKLNTNDDPEPEIEYNIFDTS